jgi:hypothetical protein
MGYGYGIALGRAKRDTMEQEEIQLTSKLLLVAGVHLLRPIRNIGVERMPQA